jgi:hypothetical protein
MDLLLAVCPGLLVASVDQDWGRWENAQQAGQAVARLTASEELQRARIHRSWLISAGR